MITLDTTADGLVAFDDDKKLAVINTKHHQGLYRNGAVVYEDMPRSSWSIHWTSPAMNLELQEAVLAALPR